MAETLSELSVLIEALQEVRADANEFHLRAQRVEDCLQKFVQADSRAIKNNTDQSVLAKLSQKLMQEIWFAKESSELRLAANLHAYL